MKGFRKIVLPGLLVMTALLFTGCGGDAADEYVKEQLEQVRSGDDTTAEMLLEQGMEDVNEDYVIPFPEELKESYCEFLKAACQKVQFEILECEKYNNGYKVRVEFTPVDVAETVKESDIQYARELQSNDLTAEVQKLLEQDTKLLEQAKAADKEKITLYLKKGSSGFEIEEAEWKNCIYSLLDGYMEPYREVAEVIDAADYLKAILDASFKGEPAQYAKHTGMTEEEVLLQYEESFTGIDLADMGMTEEQEARFLGAMKQMFKNTQYEVGTARKADGDGYVIQVNVTPNLSLKQSGEAFASDIDQGKYATTDQAKEGYLATIESYAASPVYGEPETTEVQFSMGSLIFSGSGDGEIDRLGELIIPSE